MPDHFLVRVLLCTCNLSGRRSVVTINHHLNALKGGISMTTNVTTRPAEVSRERTPERTILRDHPVEVALFNSTGFITFVWLAVRVWLGVQWIRFGWEKLSNPQWMDGTKISGFWRTSL